MSRLRDPQITRQTMLVLSILIESGAAVAGIRIAQASRLASGTLYPILNRLEDAGWIESELEAAEAGAKPLQAYRITELGAQRARQAVVQWRQHDELLSEGKIIDNSPPILGELDVCVLTAIIAAGENAYGVPVVEGVEELLGRDVSPSAVYTALDRLEGATLVSSWLGEPTKERRGRAKRYYKVEGAGELALRNALRPMQRAIAVAAEWGLA